MSITASKSSGYVGRDSALPMASGFGWNLNGVLQNVQNSFQAFSSIT
jgi:hypothetical protein